LRQPLKKRQKNSGTRYTPKFFRALFSLDYTCKAYKRKATKENADSGCRQKKILMKDLRNKNKFKKSKICLLKQYL
jgi:hypothetical protein